MRRIKIITTQGDNHSELTSSASTWGELQGELSTAGVSTSNMKAMVRETKTTLELSDARLPEGDFTLFLTASKVKSGTI